jgi:hypothetical protein
MTGDMSSIFGESSKGRPWYRVLRRGVSSREALPVRDDSESKEDLRNRYSVVTFGGGPIESSKAPGRGIILTKQLWGPSPQ